MATCNICKGEVAANQYVRAKPMVAVPGSANTYKSAPGDEHFFYHTSHGKAAIGAAIAADLKPQEGKPMRLLWNPAPKDFRIQARLQRLREQVGNIKHPEVVVMAIAAEEDRQAGVSVQTGRGAGQASGLRMITLRDFRGLDKGLAALLAEGS